MLFQTARLNIRLLTMDDLLPFHEMQGNDKVMRYADPSGKGHTFEENKIDLKSVIDHYKKPKNLFWVWAIDRKSDGEFIGTGAIIVDEKQEAELGCRFLEKYWGNRYGTEILEGLIKYGFEQMKLKALYANVDILNIASLKILEKSPLKFVKEEWNDDFKSNDRFYHLTNPRL